MFTNHLIQMVTRAEQVRRPEPVELRDDRSDDAAARKDAAARHEQVSHQAAVLDIGKKARELAVELSNIRADESTDDEPSPRSSEPTVGVLGEQERNAAVPKLEPNIFIEKEPRTPIERRKQELQDQAPLVDDSVFKQAPLGQESDATPAKLAAVALGIVSKDQTEAAPPFAAQAEGFDTGLDATKTAQPILSRDDSDLSTDEQLQLHDLAARDREVRGREQAHQSAAGPYAGAINLKFERGPDGRSYAVAGDVAIDAAPIDGDPQATLQKMATVRRAALAPAEPSGGDRQIAAQAQSTAAQARAELAAKRYGETQKLSAAPSSFDAARGIETDASPESDVAGARGNGAQSHDAFDHEMPVAHMSTTHLRTFSLVA